jgi:hypothetical protein
VAGRSRRRHGHLFAVGHLAVPQVQLNKPDIAREYLDKAIERNPSDDVRDRAVKVMESL